MENLEINVPIYRAKKVDSGEYAEGNLIEDEGVFYIIKNSVITHFFGVQLLSGESEYLYKIDPTTLAIHFPSMIDNEGNKIFASLSGGGKGGDCTFMQNGYNETFCWDSLNGCIVLKSRNYECRCFRNGCRNETNFNTYKIIGIQQ